MSSILNERCKNMILGALVADAATMGLHWIYYQAHIRKIAPDAPEFMDPDPRNFDGVPAFFAHPTRKAGACSQYGVQTLVMLRALEMSDGKFERAAFQQQFQAHFGYGGAYVGYIDHATRGTLDNLRRLEDAAHLRAQDVDFDGSPKITRTLVNKALPLLARYEGDALTKAFETALRDAYEDSAIHDYGMRLLDVLRPLPPATGADDIQLPAIAKLPGLIGRLCAQGISGGPQFDDTVTEAVRVTSDHATAVSYGKISAHMMAGAAAHGSTDAAFSAGRAVADQASALLLDKAMEMRDRDTAEVTAHFGMACDLPFGVPSVAHNIATAASYAEAVQRNIYAGGDNCGRAILVGAVMGAVHGIGGSKGIPQNWIERLEGNNEVTLLLAKLFDQGAG